MCNCRVIAGGDEGGCVREPVGLFIRVAYNPNALDTH
jgi:hypothetical protein